MKLTNKSNITEIFRANQKKYKQCNNFFSELLFLQLIIQDFKNFISITQK